MMRWSFCGLLMLVVLGGCGPGEDYSSPKSAARTFYIALVRGNAEMAKAAVADVRQQQVLEEMRGLLEGILAAQQAAVAQFGQSGNQVSGGLPSLEDLEQAQERIEGESAVLSSPGEGAMQVHLRKVGGSWKVDLFATFAMSPESAQSTLRSAAKAIEPVAQEIKSGRYKTAEEAEGALRRSLEKSIAMSKLGEMIKGM